MARNLDKIQKSILDKKEATVALKSLEVLTADEKNTLNNLNSTSKVAVWRLWVYIVSFAIWTLEKLFDVYKSEVNAHIKENEIHNFLWYQKKAKDFQYGQSLLPESDKYDNSKVDVATIIKSKIIKHVAVVRRITAGHGYLELKLAKEIDKKLSPLAPAEMQAFKAYMFVVADAGTYIKYLSLPNDDLKLSLDIYYDPLILWRDGSRKDGTNNTPVIQEINEFLYRLEFNGELVLTKLIDHLQNVEGIKIPKIQSAYAKYGAFGYQPIDETYIARAGYMLLDENNTTINYIAREI